MKQYRALFGNRNFLLLWMGSAISNIGDFFNSLALVKVLSEDPAHLGLWMALVMIAKVVPGVLLGPVAGVVADRLPRRTIMIATDLMRAVLVASLVFTTNPALIILLVGLSAAVATFHSPAYSALLPSLVKPSELVTANSLSVITGRLAMLIGNGLGAVAMLYLGVHNVFYIDAASFVLCALFLLAMSLPATAVPVQEAKQARRSIAARFTSDLKEALVFIRQTPTLRRLVTMLAIVAIPDSASNVLITTFFTVELGLAAEKLGVIWAVMGGAAVVGALAIGAIGNRVHWKHLLSVGCAWVWACVMGALLIRNFGSVTAFIGLLGLGSGAINVGIQSAVGLLVPDQIRGRVFGAWGTINNLIYVIGVLLSGWLADWIGAATAMTGFTTLYLLTGVYAWFAFRSEGRPVPAAASSAD